MARLDGRVALVTGAAGAFGLAITERLVADGARVAATDLRGDLIAASDAVLPIRHDVTDEASWAEAVERTLATYGRLDMLVNNAGFATLPETQDPETVTIAHWRAVNGVNVEGVLLGCQAGIRAMKAAGGVIVNISSIAALNPSPRMAAYGASKAAVRHLTRTVAAWCTQQGFAIRCNSIHPGWFPTDMTRGSRTPAEMDAQERSIPMGRFGEPEEIAASVAFLCSDDARYITGAKIVVDGGIVME